MKNIATLTVNPMIDVAYDVPSMVHTHTMRSISEICVPGGGGINVARVFVRLGGDARCYYLSGGAIGAALDGLIDMHQLVRRNITIGGNTRIAMVVHERETGKEYRLVPPGPNVTPAECDRCLEALSNTDFDILVVSGSEPPGMPADFYARIATDMRDRGIALVLDTSGDALRATLTAGGVYLVKPSLAELQQLCGQKLDSIEAITDAAMQIVKLGQAQLVAVTMGQHGALLARKEGSLYISAVPVDVASAIGAGDSFLAAMVHGLAREWDPVKAFRYGVAGGTAAVLSIGTGLAAAEDIEKLFTLISGE